MKKSLSSLAMVLAACFGGISPFAPAICAQAAETEADAYAQKLKDALPPSLREVPHQIYRRMPMVDVPGIRRKAGMSPKEYGQHLQRTGRQKWTKRKR